MIIFNDGGKQMRCILLISLAMALTPSSEAETYQVVIHGGRVIDPASGRDEVADVGINGRTIAAISTTSLKGYKTLNANGLVVAPGFIDLHAHAQNPKGEYYQLLDGVTTSIDMEVGRMPISDFFAGMKGKALINFGASASFLCARTAVLSSKRCSGDTGVTQMLAMDVVALNKATTPEQESQIVSMLSAEVSRGGLGYGLPIEYVPAAGRREIFRVFQAAAKSHVPVFVHARSGAQDRAPGAPIEAAEEVIADAAVTGASLQIVHIASTEHDDVPTVLEQIKGAQTHGIDVTTEVYPYNAGSTGIGSEFFSDGWLQRNGANYGDIQWPATGERLTETTFKKYRAEQPDASVIIHTIPQSAVDAAIADPVVSIASDGMPWVTGGEHPRGAGTFSRVLGVYVRGRQILDLKTALTKMTIMPARRLETVSPQMARKGRLQIGADADIVVFDPEKVTDVATYEEPMRASIGYRFVMVGGQVMVTDGKVTPDVFPGVAITSLQQ